MARRILANMCFCYLFLYIDQKGVIDFLTVGLYSICTKALKRQKHFLSRYNDL